MALSRYQLWRRLGVQIFFWQETINKLKKGVAKPELRSKTRAPKTLWNPTLEPTLHIATDPFIWKQVIC